MKYRVQLEITCDGLFNIAKRLLAGFALRDAPRQCWTAHNENAVFILILLEGLREHDEPVPPGIREEVVEITSG